MSSFHDHAFQTAMNYKKNETELIDIIAQVDKDKSYLDKDLSSTYSYCIKFLKLEENVTYNLIAVARKSNQVPELKEAIKKGQITLSNAKRITSVITAENKSHWLPLAETLPKAKLEKEIAKVNPQILTPEKVKYVSENRLKLELGVSEETMNDLKRAQEVLSQKTKGHATLEQVLATAVKEFLKREDPIEKARKAEGRIRNLNNEQKSDEQGPGTVPNRINIESLQNLELGEGDEFPYIRTPLKPSLKHEITLRDQAQCTYKEKNGQRCQERKWLHHHHIVPIRFGGANRLNNLQTLCQGHHRLKHL